LGAAGWGAPRPGPGTSWRERIETVDMMLDRGDVEGATRAWSDAHVAVLRNRQWEALVETGDAGLRIARAGEGSVALVPRVRELYLAALFHARVDGSLDGALRVADAFAGLGDDESVEACLVLAERLARGPEDRVQVAAVRDRLRPSGRSTHMVESVDTPEPGR